MQFFGDAAAAAKSFQSCPTLCDPIDGSWKASIWRSAFFMAQLSHPYMIIENTIALTRRTFVGKVMFLLFNTLGLS